MTTPSATEEGLTAREREVFQLLAAGHTGEEIAERLILSAETVRTHVRNGMRRLGCRTRVQALAVALARGEISSVNVSDDRAVSASASAAGKEVPVRGMAKGETAPPPSTSPTSAVRRPSATIRVRSQVGGERGIAADSGPGLGPAAELIVAAADAAQDGLLVTDAGTDSRGPRIVYANAAVSRITGYTPEELRGVSPSIFQGAATDRQTLDRLHEALASGHPFKGQAVNYRKDGTPFVMEWTIGAVTDASGTATHYIAVQRDATDFRLRLAEAESRARIDQLTGLDNRRQLESSLEAALPTGTGLSVLIAGVDHLHEVRERHGRLVGDEVLREVGQRLRDSAGEHDSVGRFGDEEFCLVARDLAGPDALREQAERSRRAVGRDPVTTTAGQVSVTVSVGAATADPTASHEAVLRAAERALEAARKNGRDRVELSSSADPR